MLSQPTGNPLQMGSVIVTIVVVVALVANGCGNDDTDDGALYHRLCNSVTNSRKNIHELTYIK